MKADGLGIEGNGLADAETSGGGHVVTEGFQSLDDLWSHGFLHSEDIGRPLVMDSGSADGILNLLIEVEVVETATSGPKGAHR